MKSYAMFTFLTLLTVFSSFHLSFSSPKDNKECVKPNTLKNHLKHFLNLLPKEKQTTKVNKIARACEENGQLLGLLYKGQSCRSVHNQCKVMVKRQVHIPKRTFERIKAKVKAIVNKSRKKKHRRRWTIKERKSTKENDKHIHSSKKEAAARTAAKQIKHEITQIIGKTIEEKDFNRITKKLVAKAIVMKNKNGNKKSSSGNKHETGNFCVHGIFYNLNYCCHFKNKSEAVFFANTQPEDSLFKKMLKKSHEVEREDQMRRIKKNVARIVKALAHLEKKKS